MLIDTPWTALRVGLVMRERNGQFDRRYNVRRKETSIICVQFVFPMFSTLFFDCTSLHAALFDDVWFSMCIDSCSLPHNYPSIVDYCHRYTEDFLFLHLFNAVWRKVINYGLCLHWWVHTMIIPVINCLSSTRTRPSAVCVLKIKLRLRVSLRVRREKHSTSNL